MANTTKSVDKLSIEITANAQTASKALGELTDKLNTLSEALNGMDFKTVVSDLKELSTSVKAIDTKPLTKGMTALATATSKYRNATNQITAQSKNANNTFKNVSNGVNSVYGAMSKVNSKINEFASRIRFANKETKNFAQTVGLLYARFFLLIRGIKLLTRQVKSSMDYIEVLNYFDSSFGQVAERGVEKWSEMGYDSAQAYYDSFSDRAKKVTADMSGFFPEKSGSLTPMQTTSLGMNPQELMKYQAMFAQMSSSMGTTSEQALLLSEVLTKLGADLASVKNLDFNQTWGDMASGLVGMSRTLDKYGVNIRNANMQMKLHELGINANVNALSQADKALLRTIILLDSTKYGWADLSETLDTPSNQMRMLSNNVKLLGQMIGNILLPAVASILPYLNAFVIALQRLFAWLAKILGIDLSKLQAKNTGFDNSALSDMLDDAEDLSGALDDDTDSAKKLKKQLQGFDALNNLTTKEDKSALGSNAIGGLLNDAFTDAVNDYLKAWQDAFDELENSAQKLADRIEKAFKEFVKPITQAWEKWGDFVIDGWKSAVKKFGKLITKVWEDAKTVWNQKETEKIFENIFKIVGTIGYAFGELADRIREAWSYNDNGLKILEAIRNIVLKITDHFANMADATLTWAQNLNLEPLLTAIKGFVESLEPVFDKIFGIIEDFYTQVLLPLGKWTLEEGLPNLLQVFIDFNNKVDWGNIRKQLQKLWEHLEPFAQTVGEGIIMFIQDCANALADFLNSDEFTNFLKKLEDWMDKVTPRDVADGLEAIAKGIIALKGGLLAFGAIKSVLGVITTIKEFLLLFGAGGALAGAKTTLEGIATGIEGVSTAMGGLAISGGATVQTFQVFEHTFDGFESANLADIYTDFLDGEKGAEEYLNSISALANKNADDTQKMLGYATQLKDAWERGLITTNEYYDSLKNLTDLAETNMIDDSFFNLGKYSAYQGDLEVMRVQLSEIGALMQQQGRDNAVLFTSGFEQGLAESNLSDGLASKVTATSTDEYRGVGIEVGNALGTGIIEAPELQGASNNTYATLEEDFFANSSRAEDIGRNITSGIALGLFDSESQSALTTACSSASFGLIKQFQENLGIHSPSTVFQEIARYCIEGLDMGLIGGLSSIKATTQQLANGMLSAFQNIVSKFKTIGQNLMGGLSAGVSSSASSVLSQCSSIASRVTGTFQTLWRIHSPSRVMDDMGVYFMQGLKNGLESMYQPIEQSVSGFGTKLTQAPEVYDAMSFDGSTANVSSEMSFNSDNTDTNALLRQQNAILQQILEKEFGISEGELFKSVQKSADSYRNRTGNYAFN